MHLNGLLPYSVHKELPLRNLTSSSKNSNEVPWASEYFLLVSSFLLKYCRFRKPRLLIPYKVYIPKVYIPCIPWLRIARGKQGIKYNLLLFHSRSSSSSIGSSWGHCLRCLSTAPNSLRMYDANTETDSDAPSSSDTTQDALGDY